MPLRIWSTCDLNSFENAPPISKPKLRYNLEGDPSSWLFYGIGSKRRKDKRTRDRVRCLGFVDWLGVRQFIFTWIFRIELCTSVEILGSYQRASWLGRRFKEYLERSLFGMAADLSPSVKWSWQGHEFFTHGAVGSGLYFHPCARTKSDL